MYERKRASFVATFLLSGLRVFFFIEKLNFSHTGGPKKQSPPPPDTVLQGGTLAAS